MARATSTSSRDGAAERPRLERRLGTLDGALITIGAIIGSGIFLTTSDIARGLPQPLWILAVWIVGGLLTLAGALTYAELGAMYPHTGGIYVFLREAYGPLAGFLYGWAAFFVIMSGGIAAIAVGFGQYLGIFLPFFSGRHELWSLPLGAWVWRVDGCQIAGVLAILALTAINHAGLRQGAWVQNLMTVLKIGAIGLFVTGGFVVRAPVAVAWTAPLPRLPGGLLAAFGVGMIAALWTYDGWYGLTFSAGELKNPARSLPLGLILGVIATVLMYAAMNLAYLRAIPIGAIAATPRIGEDAAAALFGGRASRWISAAIVVSTFGCLASTILYSARIYLPMAEDRLFFRTVARIHPRYHTPGVSLWTQSLWAVLLTLSGSYEQLYTYVIFASVLFHAATGAAVFVLRRTRPDHPRPYRTWGYPWVPALFILSSLVLLGNTLVERPTESLLGLGLLALGLPAYAYWRRERPAA
jgi:APA family basic amino acid/polyamine antiporter